MRARRVLRTRPKRHNARQLLSTTRITTIDGCCAITYQYIIFTTAYFSAARRYSHVVGTTIYKESEAARVRAS